MNIYITRSAVDYGNCSCTNTFERIRNVGFLLLLGSFGLLIGCTPPDIDKMAPDSIFTDQRVVELVFAAEQGDTERVEDLIKKGVNVNAVGKYNVTPLLRSLIAKNKKGYSALLSHGADPNILNKNGLAAMNKAALEEDPFWLDGAIKHGGKPNLMNTGNPNAPGQTPIYYAVSNKRIQNVKLLIAAGADLNHKDRTLSNPLLRAAQSGQYQIVYVLLEAGADYRQKDKADDDLNEWISRRDDTLLDDKEKPWFHKTKEFLKAKGSGKK